MPTLDHQGVRYHWRSIGQGTQPAVFLHCSMASGKVWVPMMTRFADRLSSRAIDMPGHGGTGMPNPALDFQVQAAGATIALIEETGAPVHLVGHSYGATIALRVARERPDLLRSLVCIEPVYFSVLDDIAHPAYADVRREEMEIVALIRQGKRLLAMQKFMARWASPGDWDRLDSATQQAMAARADFLERVGNSILIRHPGRLQRADFAAISTPTLLIRGGDGLPVIGHITDALAEIMPKARAAVVAGAGHMVPLTHESETAALLLAHWQKSTFPDV